MNKPIETVPSPQEIVTKPENPLGGRDILDRFVSVTSDFLVRHKKEAALGAAGFLTLCTLTTAGLISQPHIAYAEDDVVEVPHVEDDPHVTESAPTDDDSSPVHVSSNGSRYVIINSSHIYCDQAKKSQQATDECNSGRLTPDQRNALIIGSLALVGGLVGFFVATSTRRRY